MTLNIYSGTEKDIIEKAKNIVNFSIEHIKLVTMRMTILDLLWNIQKIEY